MNLEKTADQLFSQFIRQRDNFICQLADPETCVGPVECAHLIRRGYHAVRYEPLNAVSLCMFHARYMTEHPLAWNIWRVERIGELEFSRLWRRAMDGARPDLPAIVADLKERLAA